MYTPTWDDVSPRVVYTWYGHQDGGILNPVTLPFLGIAAVPSLRWVLCTSQGLKNSIALYCTSSVSVVHQLLLYLSYSLFLKCPWYLYPLPVSFHCFSGGSDFHTFMLSLIVVCYCIVWGGRSQRRRYQDDFYAGLTGPRGLICWFLFIPNFSPEWEAGKAAFKNVTLSRKGHNSFLWCKPLGPRASLILRWQKKNFTRVGQKKSFWQHRKMAFTNKINMQMLHQCLIHIASRWMSWM
jgi:hypothetical protein